jgi:DNA-binding transcriptional LysR family regulator
MIRIDDLQTYRHLSSEGFKRWMASSIVVGSLFAGGVLLMALAGSGLSLPPDEAVASNLEPTGSSEISAAEKLGGIVSAFELMKRASGQLPVQPPDEQAF